MSGQVIDTNKYKYKRMKVRDARGVVRYSANNGDAVTRALLGMTHEELIQVMQGNGMQDRLGKHAEKNYGHFRMMLGQALRSVVKKGGKVRIRGISISGLDQEVPLKSGLVEETISPRQKNSTLPSDGEV